MFKYKPDLYGVADKKVLAVGLILVGVCAVVRTVYEGKEWIKRSIRLITLFCFIFPNLKEEQVDIYVRSYPMSFCIVFK